ncbi:MAG: NAD(P)-binding domain-containing protein [Bacteroidota bacterium]
MQKPKIGILGSGAVAQALGTGFARHGHQVMLGTRDGGKLARWLAATGEGARVGSFAEAAAFGEILVLAVKGTAAEDVLHAAGPARLEGKTVLDATNPIAEAPPVGGVLTYFTGPNESLMERLQHRVPGARFVKCFSSVGSALMVEPRFQGGAPTMFICGDHPDAKSAARMILDAFGWDVADMGGVEAARAIEPLAMLWCIPGFRENSWMHAFRLLRS